MSITRSLIEQTASISYDGIPETVRAVAHHCVLDWFGCAIAGSREPLTNILVDELRAGEAGAATLVARRETATPLTAALINGAMSHALDYDDTHTLMSGHPSAPVIPTALALADRDDRDGASFLTAVVVGIETECRVGAIVNPGHYALGFHATGTLGTFGAAAAASHLLELDEERWANALALAGTQASGLKSAFGTMTKPLHAGRAASNGLLSAMLARGGYTGAAGIIETAQGFASTHGGGEIDGVRFDALRGRWLIADTLFKYHASCYLTHAAIDAASRLRAEAAIAADDIESVEVRASTGCMGVCDLPEPQTGLEGKFSLRATAAMALLGDDTSDPASFSDARMRDPAFVAMRDRVTFVPTPGLSTTRATVVVRASGRELSVDADTGTPESDLARQSERLRAKFMALTSPVIGGDRAHQLATAFEQVDSAHSMRDIAALVRDAAMAAAR
jgi:2-methylcitrate dehydratase PrpD